jgi:hypothetical protein
MLSLSYAFEMSFNGSLSRLIILQTIVSDTHNRSAIVVTSSFLCKRIFIRRDLSLIFCSGVEGERLLIPRS